MLFIMLLFKPCLLLAIKNIGISPFLSKRNIRLVTKLLTI